VNYQYKHADADELYLHRYSTVEACAESVITRVNIEARDDIEWTGYSDELEKKHREAFPDMAESERQKRIQEELSANSRSELSSYVEVVTDDIVNHFRTHVLSEGFKGMVVTRSRRSAALYGETLKRKLGEDNVRVLYTDMEGDDEMLSQFHTTADARSTIVDDFKRPGEPPVLLVVCDMLLTGFDASILRTMYLDRPLQNHNLLQAIARTNRPMEGKEFGEIIDYTGITRTVDEMFEYAEDEMDAYLDEDKDEFLIQYESLIEDILSMFNGLGRADREGTTAFNEWFDCLDTEPKQEQFLQKWRKVKRLRANIAPDDRLLKDGERLEDDYRWIQDLARALDPRPPPPPGGDFRERTLELVDEHVDVYKESSGGEHLRTIDGADIESIPVQITRKKDELLDSLEGLEDMSPQYKMLGEKVQEIAVRWNENTLSNEEALERLRELESEVEQAEQEIASSTREERARAAINSLLDEEYDDVVSDDAGVDAVVELVLSVYQETEEQMRGAFEEKLRERQVRNLRTALAKDNPAPKEMELAMSDEFLEDAVYYLDETMNTRVRAL
jgi:type I restriction enzyme R subunit